MSAPVYLTLAQVKAYMPENQISTTNTWDAFVTTVCENVSRAFDTLTFREPGAYAVAAESIRYYDGVSPLATDFILSLFLRSGPGNITDELAALTEVAIAPSGGNTYTPVDSGDFWLWPYNAAQQNKPYTRIDLTGQGSVTKWPNRPHSVRVTGKFGYSTTLPADVYEALLLYVIRFIRKAQQNYLDVGTIMDTGQVFVGLKTDEDIRQLIGIYKKGVV